MKRKGIGCSPGRVKGNALILESNDSLEHISNNSILVVKRSSPEWFIALLHASGIVCESGGRMSHLAILCRELGKPCVSGIDGIYSAITNGDCVVIDGSTGEVIVNE